MAKYKIMNIQVQVSQLESGEVELLTWSWLDEGTLSLPDIELLDPRYADSVTAASRIRERLIHHLAPFLL